MSDPRRPAAGWAIAGAVASLVVLSVALPVVIAFLGAIRSAPFFGVQPSETDRAESAIWFWAAFAVSGASLIVIIVLAVVNRRRVGFSALAVISVLAIGAAGVWLIVALGTQRVSGAEGSPVAEAGSPSPTVVAGRYIPDDHGTATAAALIKRLGSAPFANDAGPGAVKHIVIGAGAVTTEVRGTAGDVAVGAFVGHRTCVLGEVRAGKPTWSIVGTSVDGGCLGPQHG